MRVGVEDADLEELTCRGVECPSSHRLAVDAVQHQAVEVREAEALAEFHHEGPPRDPTVNLLRNHHVQASRDQALADLSEVLHLVLEVQLEDHVPRPTIQQPLGIVPLVAAQPTTNADDSLQGPQVQQDELLDALVLELHCDLPATTRFVPQRCGVHLRDARRGDRYHGEVLEQVLHLPTELGQDEGSNVRLAVDRGSILQLL
mmetsp:Transcript_11812/g.37903  ORF Transcript_11812/g.37903 Transcript_11812/m.37903 type:complete len:203 (-) Transcript_11812:1045-1653(-)